MEFDYRDVRCLASVRLRPEDLPNVSFAGQHEACGRCFASLFTDRAMYPTEDGFGHFKVALPVAIKKQESGGLR